MKPKSSLIWNYFVEVGENCVKCKICFKNYSNKGRSTTPLKGHLKAMHKEQYEEFCQLDAQREAIVKTPSHATRTSSSMSPPPVTASQHGSRQKRSDVWQCFEEIDANFAKCKICYNNYSRRGLTTSSLKGHLKSMHKEKYKELYGVEKTLEIEDDEIPSGSTETPSKQTSRHKTNNIWHYFKEIDDNYAECQVCFKNYSWKGRSTSSLKGHLKSMHKEKYDEFCDMEEQIEIEEDEVPSATPFLLKTRQKTSSIWHYFNEVDENYAECKICFNNYSRKGRTTTSLKGHLKSMHKEKYDEFCEMEEEKEIVEIEISSTETFDPQQKTKDEPRKRSQKWDTSHVVSRKIDDLIGEMIALQNLPPSFVEGIGFQRVMQMVMPNYKLRGQQYFTDLISEEIYPKMARKIGKILKQFPKLSFTADVCSEPLGNVSLLGLSAHGITEDFTRMQVLLKCCSPYNRHTSDEICHHFRMMLLEWDIQDEQLHCFIRDGGSKRIRVTHQACKVSELSCTVHTLQLCVRSALENKEIQDLVEKCNRITGHFRYSHIAKDELRQIQVEQLDQPPLQVIQNDATRWNSTFHMIERLLKIKDSICLYASNHNIPPFTSSEWWRLTRLVEILRPFEETTRKLSDKKTSISSVIPLMNALKHTLHLLKENLDTKPCFKNIIKDLIDDINSKFGDLSNNPLYSLATYLDPRFKLKFFDDNVKKQVQSELVRLLSLHELVQEPFSDGEEEGSAPKRSKTELQVNDDGPSTSRRKPTETVESKLADLLKNDTDDEEDQIDDTTDTKSQLTVWKLLMKDYNKESLIPLNEDPLMWWRFNTKYHAFAPIVRTYLSPPPGSIPSMELMGEAGINYESLTNSPEDDKTPELLFVKHNLPLLNFDY